MSESQQTCSEPEIVEQGIFGLKKDFLMLLNGYLIGIRLIIHGTSENVQQFAVTYQWIDFKNQPTLVDQPEQLVSADDAPSFKHVAIYLLRPEDNLTELVMQFQSSEAKGVVLVHTTDELPVFELNPPPSDNINIPVVLIKQKVGQGILKEVEDSSKTVNIIIVRESSVDTAFPEYQSPDDRIAVAAETPEEKPGFFSWFKKSKKFYLTKQLEKLLYVSGTKQPAVMWNDNERMLGTFQLLDKFEAFVSAGSINGSKLENKVTKICQHLQTCVEKNYAVDFPSHCLLVLRLRS